MLCRRWYVDNYLFQLRVKACSTTVQCFSDNRSLIVYRIIGLGVYFQVMVGVYILAEVGVHELGSSPAVLSLLY
jgi:hypothetical protein